MTVVIADCMTAVYECCHIPLIRINTLSHGEDDNLLSMHTYYKLQNDNNQLYQLVCSCNMLKWIFSRKNVFVFQLQTEDAAKMFYRAAEVRQDERVLTQIRGQDLIAIEVR